MLCRVPCAISWLFSFPNESSESGLRLWCFMFQPFMLWAEVKPRNKTFLKKIFLSSKKIPLCLSQHSHRQSLFRFLSSHIWVFFCSRTWPGTVLSMSHPLFLCSPLLGPDEVNWSFFFFFNSSKLPHPLISLAAWGSATLCCHGNLKVYLSYYGMENETLWEPLLYFTYSSFQTVIVRVLVSYPEAFDFMSFCKRANCRVSYLSYSIQS